MLTAPSCRTPLWVASCESKRLFRFMYRLLEWISSNPIQLNQCLLESRLRRFRQARIDEFKTVVASDFRIEAPAHMDWLDYALFDSRSQLMQ